ncbi:MAG: NAD-dependent epimerase/dehydratase family protein [Blastocatellia bacterium]|nr:NAD-dependent epimerase/dehydratase family protein [Blastocatellia bacterium]
MKILVTGGAGFIGSHLVDAFVAAGHEVFVVDNLSTGFRANINPSATFIEADIRDDRIKEVVAEVAPDVISHQAAQIDVRISVNNPCLDAQINIVGSLNLLEAAREAGVKRVMFASTGGAIYGEQDYFPADEAHPTRPLSPYGIAKLAVEKYLDYYRWVYGVQTSVLRYANVYGPRQNPHGEAGVVAIFCERMCAGTPLVINGDGEQTRDYVYVGDVVRANLTALADAESDVYNVGTAIETNVNQIFHHLREAAGLDLEENHGPAKLGEQRRSVITARRLAEKFNWQPETDLATGLRHTFEFFRQKIEN